MTPAEELQAAVTKLREAAENATPGPWDRYSTPGYEVFSEAYTEDDPHADTYVTNGSAREPDATWIALMSPEKAEPLLAWLKGAAKHAAKVSDPRNQQIIADQDALAFARILNGGAS